MPHRLTAMHTVASRWGRNPMRREARVLLLLACSGIVWASPEQASAQLPGPTTTAPRIVSVSGTQGTPDHSREVVLVAGASGQTGREIVRPLRDLGYRVRAMARSAQRLADLGPGVQPVVGDVTDPPSLVRALSQVNVVISAIGGRWPIGENGFEAVDYRGNLALIDAARRARLSRFMLVSAGSAGRKASSMHSRLRRIRGRLVPRTTCARAGWTIRSSPPAVSKTARVASAASVSRAARTTSSARSIVPMWRG
jgi:hypothetical protein